MCDSTTTIEHMEIVSEMWRLISIIKDGVGTLLTVHAVEEEEEEEDELQYIQAGVKTQELARPHKISKDVQRCSPILHPQNCKPGFVGAAVQ
jgi:ABC-type multidrug transport system ATPase subunit